LGDRRNMVAVGREDMAGRKPSRSQNTVAVHIKQQPVVCVDRAMEPHGMVQARTHIGLVPRFVILGDAVRMGVSNRVHCIAIAEIGEGT